MGKKKITLGIVAHNIRLGGGLIHLKELLRNANPQMQGFSKVIIWGGSKTLDTIEDRPWLIKIKPSKLDKGVLNRILWERFELTKSSELMGCDVLFVPGGSYNGMFFPYVTMFQNMQVFETKELNREGFSLEWFRLRLLQKIQLKTFRNCSGLICLSEYSLNYLQRHYPNLGNIKTCIIPHGINDAPERKFSKLNFISSDQINLLYVSTVKKYKHQWNLIDSVGKLRDEGYNINLDLIGSGDLGAIKKVKKAIERNYHHKNKINYYGNLDHDKVSEYFSKADIFVFASSCETLSISLLEAMKASMPIACSSLGPMSEILKDAGMYFNPLYVDSITDCIRSMIKEPELRKKMGLRARDYANKFCWKKCSQDTFKFIRESYVI